MYNFKLPTINDHGGDLSRRWFVEYYYRNPETNKMSRFRVWISNKLTSRTARSIKANEIRVHLTAKLNSGFNPFESENKEKTIRQALEEIFLLKAATCGTRAKHTYKNITDRFADYLQEKDLSRMRPRELSRKIAQDYFDHLLTDLKLSKRTYNNHLTVLRTFFEELHNRDYCEVNIFKKIKKLGTGETDLNFFSSAERQLIREQLPQDHYPLFCISLLVYYCYLRPAEIVRLKVRDLNLEAKHILIRASQSKNKRSQIVVMPDPLIEALKLLQLENYPPEWFAFSYYRNFVPAAVQTAPTRISEAWREIVQEKYGIKKGIYLLKHTGAGEAFSAGIDARSIQLQIRHHSLDQTQIYLSKFNNKSGESFRQKMPGF